MKVKIRYGDLVSGRHKLLFGEEIGDFNDSMTLAELHDYVENQYYIRDWTEVTLEMNNENS